MTTLRKRWKLGTVVNAALVALAFGLLGMVIWQHRDDLREVFARRIDWRLLAMAQTVFLIGIVLTFLRWFLLVRVIDDRFTPRAALLLGFIGYVFNLVIPGAVGGDLIKAAYLARMHIKKTQAIASMVIDRILGLLGLFLLASIGGWFAWRVETPVAVRRLIVLAWSITGLGLVALVAILGRVITRFLPRREAAHAHGRIHLVAEELNAMATTYCRRLDVVVLGGVLAMMSHSLNILAFFLLGEMLFPSMPTTLAQHFLMAPLTLFTMAVPLPFGALGLGEKVADQLFNLVGHPSGGLAMMGFRLVMYGGGLVGALVYLAKLKEVRELTATAHHIEEELVAGELEETDEIDSPTLQRPARLPCETAEETG